jgi:hypothetical protein
VPVIDVTAIVSCNILPWQIEYQRYLVRHGLIVEKLSKDRKLRHVFLFNDVIVCAKQKLAKLVLPLVRHPLYLEANE